MSQMHNRQTREAQLSPAQRELLKLWKQGSRKTNDTPPHITPRTEEGPAPLSFSQRRLWFLDQLEPGNPFYNISVAFRLVGPLHVAFLKESLNHVILRHEILRTTFTIADEKPLQQVHDFVQCPFQELHLSSDHSQTEIQRLLREEARTPFDLQKGPLLRTNLLRLSKHEHILQISMHHIISDGGSMDIFLADMAQCYNALVAGKKPALGPLPVQYADYASWQQAEFTEEKLAPLLTYWKNRLNDISPQSGLPTDTQRSATQQYRGSLLEMQLPTSLTEALKALCTQEKVTPFAALLASFQAFLAQYTGQNDIAVGTDVAEREHAELEEVIGFFVNTMVVRTTINPRLTFRELLHQVNQQLLEDLSHRHLPFDVLVAELQPRRDISHSALFQIMFTLQNTRIDTISLTDLRLERLVVDSEISRFDLIVDLFDTGQDIRGIVEYNTDLFHKETIMRLLDSWQTFLTAALATPERQTGQLPLLNEAQRHRMLFEWNTTSPRIPYPEQCDFPMLFAHQVEQTPDSIAVICEEEQVTYAHLKQRADQLTALLQRHRVGPESVIGIYLERSVPMLISLLAILQAGAAYVPLEPEYPPERVRLLLEDTSASVILSTRELLQTRQLNEQGIPVLCIEELFEQQPSSPQAPASPHPDQLAYVIFTSGSTGRPKGAMLSHSGMINHLYAKLDILQLGKQDRVAQSASLSFDISLWQFLAPLLVGGSVCILTPTIMHTPFMLTQALRRFNINTLELVPSQIRMLLEDGEQRNDSEALPLRWLISTGEAIPPLLCRQWLQRFPVVPIINTYGATECSDDVTHKIISELPDERSVNVAVGRPIANMQIYILNDDLEPVPVGVTGHIYIGGQGVGRGYIHNPQRTAETYLPDPFSKQPGARFYKTGDIGRYWHDGSIECLGRDDTQVKVRGYRIELGEIETLLLQHEYVKEAVVVVRNEADDKQIVAYIVPHVTMLSPQLLRQHLQQNLPAYMLPSHFVLLEQLPLNANGKVDRRALPAPTSTYTEEEYVAPESPAEKLIAQIWADLLALERVGLHDNFFTLGGHSILATQIILRIRSIFEVDLPLRHFFERPTVAGIVEELALLYEDRETVNEIASIYQEVAQLSDEELEHMI
uniref:Carrier domain-containing protein n=1 Tax=Thermosporothrix sp. COM3 TaxID=2490863 RepID=A0A455SM41_9CHLR|nr:hypothetical protein KTC_28200 [Thermosporothrix sp. COM3]